MTATVLPFPAPYQPPQSNVRRDIYEAAFRIAEQSGLQGEARNKLIDFAMSELSALLEAE